jgi:hypothetical protein
MSLQDDNNPNQKPSALTNMLAFGIVATGAGGVCLAVYLVSSGLGMIVNKMNPPPEPPASQTMCYKGSYISSYSSGRSPFYHIILKDEKGTNHDYPVASSQLQQLLGDTNNQVSVDFGLDPLRQVRIENIFLTTPPVSCE